ncbi:MAG: hypothetical protein K8S25_04630 [Alphaproteobacteria bacterium]|nr:hypothetical protein [Alphaproteobacteria bacterium]
MKIDQRDADAALGGEVHAHSSWILPLLLLVIAAAIAGGFFIFLAGPTVDDFQGNAPWPTASADTADIRIDGALLRIPANYTKFRRSRSNGDQDDVPMHALLPNLSPWSPGDAKEFASNAPDARVVHFTLATDRATLTYQEKFERGIKPLADKPEGEPGPFGLTQYKFGPLTGYENTEWFTAALEDGSQLVMRCDASPNADFGSSCMRVTRMADNIGLTYKFKRAHLAQWKQLDAKIMALIASFHPK